MFVYTRDQLLALQTQAQQIGSYVDFPEDIIIRKPRRRGHRGGVKSHYRKRWKRGALPSIIMGNVRSLNNKMDELSICTKYVSDFREASVMCYTETWL